MSLLYWAERLFGFGAPDDNDRRFSTLERGMNEIADDLYSYPDLLVKRLTDTAILPKRGSKGAIGLDICADQVMIVPPYQRAKISTGIAMAVPSGYYGRVAPRSGLAWGYGINVRGGVLDEDYRGEVFVILHNSSPAPFHVEPGMRIAQVILEQASQLDVVEVDDLDSTDRGEGGFGSTGIHSTGA